MRLFTQSLFWVGVLFTAVFAFRRDDRSIDASIEGSSTIILQNSHSSLRSALPSDFSEKANGTQSSLRFAPGVNQAQAIVARANRNLHAFGSEMKVTSTIKDNWGITHIRMQQFHKGIAVLGSEVIAHINNNGELVAVSGKWAPTMSVDTNSTMTFKNARATIDTGSMGVHFQREPRKVIFENRIVYESIVVGPVHSKKRYRIITDAKTGELMVKQPLIIEASPSPSGSSALLDGQRLTGEDGSTVTVQGWHNTNGNYFLSNLDSVWGVYNVRKNDWEQRTTASWGNSDPAAFSLGKNIATVQTWTMTVLGRNSFDNAGSQIVANAHEGTDYVNAYWDGNQLYFGDGDGVEANPLTVIDVVGHEYGHAITQYTSNLDYYYESGALNESYSDILGTIIEFATEPDGRSAYPHGISGHADWLCGEDCWLQGDALRDLENPQRFGQPSYYKGTLWCSGDGDNGGVHCNSGVQNFAFYLLSEGGIGTNDGHGYSINGLGITASRDIALYANMYLLTSSSQFRDSRDAWMLAASILNYDTTTVRDVWTAVGLPPLEKHLDAAPLALDFGKVGVGIPDTLWVELSNSGAAQTTVLSFEGTNPVFNVADSTPLAIPPMSTVRVPFVYNPRGFVTDIDTIHISSDAKDNPLISISLLGIGTHPAAMTINPHLLKASLNSGDSTATSITITNVGEADLKIYATAEYDHQTDTSVIVKAIKGTASKAQSYSQLYGKKTEKIKPTQRSMRSVPVSPGTRVLYISTIIDDNGSDMFVNQLRQIDGMEQLDVIGAYDKTPTLESMQAYDAVIVASDYPFADPALLGNNLADYVDAGGKIILLVASIANTGGYGLSGRITLPEYMPIVTGGPDFNGGFNPVFIHHPITEGITSLSTWLPILSTAVTTSGSSLGTYQDGSLVGAYNKDKPIVAINVIPEDGEWDGDLAAMIGNVINWSSGSWLSVKPQRTPIVVKALKACTLSVGMNAGKLFGGLYSGAVKIAHNDPSQANPALIPCTLSVHGIALFSVTPTVLSYDTVWTGRSKTITLLISNPGTASTTVTGITNDNPAFSISAPAVPFQIAPKKTLKIPVTFSPVATTKYTGKLTITTTAEVGNVAVVSLSGYGIAPPKISIKPLTIGATLDLGKTSTQTFRITNQGGATFHYSLQLSDSAAGTLGESAVYGAFGDSIYRIDPTSGEFIGKPITVKGMLTPVGLAFDGQLLYVAIADTTITIINPVSGAKTGTIILPSGAHASDVGISDSLIAVSSIPNETVYVYNKRTLSLVTSWELPGDATGQIAMRGSSGEIILATSGYVSSYNVLTGQLVTDFQIWIPYDAQMSFAAQSNLLIYWVPGWSSVDVVSLQTGNGISGIPLPRQSRGICANEAGNALPWMSLQKQNGALKGSGAFVDIPVTFNSVQVPAGTINGMVTITNLDGGTPGPYSVSCVLTVNAKSLLSAASKTTVFDTTWTGTVDTASFEFYNAGSAPTEIRTITTTGSGFSFGATIPVVVKPYSTSKVLGFFSPTAKGSFKGQYVFQNTSSDNPKITIAASGVSVVAPKLTSSESSIVTTLLPGDTSAMSIVLSNSGDVAYPFFIRGRSSLTSVSDGLRALSPNKTTLYQSNYGVISELDPITGRQIGKTITIPITNGTYNEQLSFDGTNLYWTSGYDSMITVIDPVRRIVTGTVPVPFDSVRGSIMAVTPTHILMSSNYSPMILVFDKTNGRKVGEWPALDPVYWVSYICGGGSQGSVFLSDGYIIAECDESTGVVLNSFNAPVNIRSLDYSTASNLLLVNSNNSKDSVTSSNISYFINAQTGEKVDSILIPSQDYYNNYPITCDEAGIPQTWVSVNSPTGVVPPHGSATVSVLLDARKTGTGVYVGSIDAVYTGKKHATALSVSCTLTVANGGRLSVTPASLDFGKTVIKTSKTMSLSLFNSGNLAVTVKSVSSDNSAFTISASKIVVKPQSTVQLPVTFTPTKTNSYSGTITIKSDALNSLMKTAVTGTGVKK